MTIGTYEILSVILNYANSLRNYRLSLGEDYPDDCYEVLDGAEYGLYHLMWEVCVQNEFDFASSLINFGVDVESAKEIMSKVSPKPVMSGTDFYNGYNLVCHIIDDIGYHISTVNSCRDELTKCWYQGMSAGLMIVLCEFCEVLKVDMLEELKKIEDVAGEEIYTHLGEAYSVYIQ